MDTVTRNRVDPVVTEIVRNGVIAVTGEMKTNLMRTAYNTIIYEALDFTTGLFTADGRTVSIGLGLPTFIRGMAETVKAKRKHFGDDIHPGDMFLHNDPYTGGTHLNDVALIYPIFADSRMFVQHAYRQVRRRGLSVGNVDATVIADAPKLTAHKARMRGAISRLLGVSAERVSVKAKTTEGFAPGKGGIAAQAVVLLTPSKSKK